MWDEGVSGGGFGHLALHYLRWVHLSFLVVGMTADAGLVHNLAAPAAENNPSIATSGPHKPP